MIINTPILHSFDIFDLIYSTSNYNYLFPPKIFNSLKTTLDKKSAEKMRSLKWKYATYVQIHTNFCICSICRKICDMQVL